MYLNSSVLNESYCNGTLSSTQKTIMLVIMGCTGLISFSLGMVAILLVFCLKLHKLFTYRLAMYQVMAGIMFSLVMFLSFPMIFYNGSLPFVIICKLQAFFIEYFIWMKLLFTISLTFHLFCLVVFLKNFKQLELFYILFSTLFPVLFSWIPFIHNTYGLAGAWCWIRNRDTDCATKHYYEGIVEEFTLWYGPLFGCLTISLVAVAVILAVMVWRVCRSQSVRQPLLENYLKEKHKETLKELLPLLIYPAIFYLTYLFPLANRIYDVKAPFASFKLSLLHSFFISSVGLFSGAVLIIHVLVVKSYQRAEPQKGTQNKADRQGARLSTSTSSTSNTTYECRTESQVEDMVFEICQ